MAMSVDVWVRGTNEARTEPLVGVPADPATWTDADVRQLLTAMLLALERVHNPGGDPPAVSLRGFSWIVSPDDRPGAGPAAPPASADGGAGVLVHLDMRMGTASAGPFAIGERALSTMIERVMAGPETAPTIH